VLEITEFQVTLDALRSSGAAANDPVRFAYLEALARRAAGQPEAIRKSLCLKLSAAADDLATRPAARPAKPPTETAPADTTGPLAELLAYIGQLSHEPPEAAKDASADRTRQAPELKSIARFRDEWSKLSAEQQFTQTLAQAPENAGPMNAQHLVLRSLQVMRDIAPDYLQGFMSYIDTLIWLEHAAPTRPAASRPAPGEGANKKHTAKRSATKR
jgi:hypothetical protein